MRRANGAILGILLATVAVPAFAADMPVKAAPPPPPLPDWSGVYSGIAAGGAWGRQTLNTPVAPLNNLFGTSADRIFNGSPVLIQPDFDMGFCVIDGCNRLKSNGFIGGGFAGVQKQWGNWVIGIEGSWDWTSMKKSLSATTSDLEDVIRIVPTTTITVPGQTITVPGQIAPVTVSVPGQIAPVTGTAAVPGQTAPVTGTAAVPGQTAPVTGTAAVGPVTGTIVSSSTVVGPIPITIPLPGPLPDVHLTVPPIPVPITGNVSVPGQTAPVTGTAAVAPVTAPVTGTAAVAPVTAPVTGTATVAPVTATGTATVAPVNINVLPVNVTIPLPRETTVTATVTRSVDVSSKIDQIADLRGKFGIANAFLGPNWLLYFTGGAAVGHFERTLTLTQTVSVAGDGTRTNTFQSSTGDTRLGWVVGGGFDWKMTPNVLLGVLYRHHEFPKSTVSFIDDSGGSGRPVSFGASRAHVDSVQGRLSLLFPIQ
jgi:opacity protein-like surface antigen